MTEQEEQQRAYWNCEHLYDAAWQWETYQKPSPFWDHEHCHICMSRIAEANYGDPEALQTVLKYVYPSAFAEQRDTDHEEWLCPDCFEELKDTFRWRIAGSGASVTFH